MPEKRLKKKARSTSGRLDLRSTAADEPVSLEARAANSDPSAPGFFPMSGMAILDSSVMRALTGVPGFGGVGPHEAPALGTSAAQPAGVERAGPADWPARGVLVIGLGTETGGDGGVGLHLMRCLSQMPWPAGVTFCGAEEATAELAGRFARVIVLDAMEGPERAGSLYRAEAEMLLADPAAAASPRLSLLASLRPEVRRRVSVVGVQPGQSRAGESLSPAMLAVLPLLMPYLRAMILKTAADVSGMN